MVTSRQEHAKGQPLDPAREAFRRLRHHAGTKGVHLERTDPADGPVHYITFACGRGVTRHESERDLLAYLQQVVA